MEDIQYEMKTSARARHTRIAVYPDDRVVVTRSTRTSLKAAEEFVRSKNDWIRKKLEHNKTKKRIPLPTDNSLNKDEILKFVKSRIYFFNQYYKFNVGNVSIKNNKSLWGSCSRNKNLNFNHKIIHLTAQQADYIIVHELCHLKEFNHSENFWKLVSETIPDYQIIRQELKNYSFY